MITIDDDFDAPVQQIPVDDPFAVEWLERLARNVPHDVPIGEPLTASFDPAPYAVRFRTPHGVFYSFHAHAERLVRIGEGDNEVTEFCSWVGGRETQRTARRSSDLEGMTA